MPVPIKDLTNVAGVLTTQGSPIYKDNIPTHPIILVEHLEDNGGVIYAKSNTPEFGAGANTFNEVFGATRNPWDTVALRRRLLGRRGGGARDRHGVARPWLRHGRLAAQPRELLRHRRDCGRASAASRIPRPPRSTATSAVQGPMARNVEDLALLLDAMSGEHPADPLSLPSLPTSFLSAARSGKQAEARRLFARSRHHAGRSRSGRHHAARPRCASPRPARSSRKPIRTCARPMNASTCCARSTSPISKAALLRTKRDLLKPEVIWNIEEGLKLTVEQLERAEAQRVAMTARTLEFFKTYDLLLTPATIVAPFPIENRYVAECAGKKFDNYVEWLGIVYAITLVCCPALSLPCGFTASGLPVGLAGGGSAARRGTASRRCQGCWRTFWACAAPRRSIQGLPNNLTP